MCQILERRPSENNPQTYTQGFFRQNIALPLIERKGYLCIKAGLVDRAEKQGATFELTLRDYIPEKGGGRVQGGLKANASKPEMIRFCVYAWGVLRKLFDWLGLLICQSSHRELEMYLGAMQHAETDVIAMLDFEQNSDLNANSLKMPAGEEARGFLEGGAFLPEKKFQVCTACDMKTTHHPPGTKEIIAERRKLCNTWKAACNQFEKSKTNSTVAVPLNPKNNQPYTSMPPAPKLPAVLIVCKAAKMTHSRGIGGYKCLTCSDCSCGLCKNTCKFVTSTE